MKNVRFFLSVKIIFVMLFSLVVGGGAMKAQSTMLNAASTDSKTGVRFAFRSGDSKPGLAANEFWSSVLNLQDANKLLFGEILSERPNALLATLVVNSTADPGVGGCDANECTLREAIAQANSSPGADTINFDLPGAGPHTIQLTGVLPNISTNVEIVNNSGESVTVRRNTGGDYRIFTILLGTVTISGLTVTNGVSYEGGGIFNDGALTLINTTVSGNSAQSRGGGILNGGTLTIRNSTISGNTASNGGGGIFNFSDDVVTLVNSTVSGNSAADDGGGIGNANFAFLRNSIVADNYRGAGTAIEDDIGIFPVSSDSAFNLIGTGGAGGLVNGVNNNQVGVADPGLGALANNGGATQTHALLIGSPAIDKGNKFDLTTDQRGLTRPVDLDDAIYPDLSDAADIGAFEKQNNSNNFVVSSTADPGNGTCDAAECTLREAITQANANPDADTISFDLPGAGPHTIQLTGALPNISTNVEIVNNSGKSITVRRSTGGNYRILTIDANVTAAIFGLTVTNGVSDLGGGIFNRGTLTLTNSTLTGNNGGNSGVVSNNGGGGIYNSGGTVYIRNSAISGNNSNTFGGGVYNDGGALTIENSTISANSANSGFGGGIQHNSGTLTIANSTISGNNARFGGGISTESGAASNVQNSTISGNSARYGGGIHNNGSATLTSVTITNNRADSNDSGFGTGGGIFNNSSILLHNTIVADNYRGTSTTPPDDDITSSSTPINSNSSYNLIGTGGAGGLTNGANGNLVGVANPGLGALANNGGPTQTHALLANSPAIDKGNSFGLTADQRGFSRPVDVSTISNVADGTDIGAFELQTDNTAPTVQFINRASPNPTGAASVNYTVKFSEAVTGVEATDFAIVASGVTGAAIANVSGSGDTYAVTISTGTGSGTLQLVLNDNDSIMDGAGNPLGGVGANNGSFAGQTYTIDRQPPTVVSIVRASSNPVAPPNSSAQFTVTFSEPVTGVDVSDFSLTTTNLSNSAVTGVSGSGATYTVTVNTGATSTFGTLRLDVTDNDTIVDVMGYPLGGGGAGNGDFTTGESYTVGFNNYSSFVVNSVADTNDGVCSALGTGGGNQDCTLREAISLSNTDIGTETITFDIPGDGPHTIQLTGALPDLSDSVTITNASGKKITVRRNTGGDYRIFTILGMTATISGLTITNGSIVGKGGGIFNSGTLTLDNCTVNGNNGTAGGGGIYNTGTLTVANCAVFNNTTDVNGGGGGGGIAGVGTITIRNSTISGNAARFAGAMFLLEGNTTLTSVTVTNNRGNNECGGIWIEGATVLLQNTIVVDNYRGAGTANEQNFRILSGSINPDSSYNLIGTGESGGLTNGVNNNQVGVAEPGLGALNNNGGTTLTHALLINSPAVDKGNRFGLTTDQRGLTRPVDLDNATYPNASDAADIGALEAQSLPTSSDSTPPTVQSVVRASSNPIAPPNTNVQFTVTFSEAVTGVDVSDFGLTTTNLNNSSITGVSGSGATYTVTVNTGAPTGLSGTLRLDVIDDDTIVDLAGNLLGGGGAGNGNFTSGERYSLDNYTDILVNSIADTNDGLCNALGTGGGNQDCTLREAVVLANADVGPETINFDLPGNGPHTIQLTEALPGLTGNVNITNTSGESVTVRGEGSAHWYRIFAISANVTATISNLNITNGYRFIDPYSSDASGGAGIHNNGTLTLSNSTVNGNTCAGISSYCEGGGIFNGGTLTIQNSTISGNEGSNGGGIANVGTLTLANNTVVSGNTSAQGGGIENSGTLNIQNSTVSGNEGSFGGGIYNKGGTTNIQNSTISGNTGFDGGGILNFFNGVVTLVNSTVSNNTAGEFGGGIGNQDGQFTARNSTISGNACDAGSYNCYGGGIFNSSAMSLTSVTITDNRTVGAINGGGIDQYGGSLLLRNSIVADNYRISSTTVEDDIFVHEGTISSDSAFNLIGTGGAGGLTNGVNNNQVGVANPGLGALANNGGATRTHALLETSPAVDKGSSFGLTTDQRGLTRPVDLAAVANAADAADIGAFELQAAASGQGFEGDLAPRNSGGDGFVDADDIQQIRRFSVGLDMPYQTNELQRADISPRSALGDGFVDADDVEQARRYSVGFDALQNAGGPTAPPPQNRATAEEASERANLSAKGSAEAAQGRAVRVINQTSSAGQTVVVPINVDTMGDETGYTFSIDFDETKLTANSVAIGDLGGNVIANINNTNGTIGFSVTSFSGPNGTIASVMNATLVRVTFTVLANAAAGTTPINFTDTPARKKVSGVDPQQQPLPQPTYENGAVSITGPTAATVTVAGRVITAQGRGIRNVVVTLTDARGDVRTAVSTSFGYFRFADVAVGETYVVSVRAKRFGFSQPTQVLQVNDEITDLTFVALE